MCAKSDWLSLHSHLSPACRMFLSALFGSQHKDVCLCAQRRRHAMKKISDKTSSSANFLNVLFGDLVHSLLHFFQSYNLQLFPELLAFAPGKCWFVPSLSVLSLSLDLSLIFSQNPLFRNSFVSFGQYSGICSSHL